MLHLVIADIAAGVDAMAGRGKGAAASSGLWKVTEAVNQYAGHFDHPGFKPIRVAH